MVIAIQPVKRNPLNKIQYPKKLLKGRSYEFEKREKNQNNFNKKMVNN